MVYQKIVTSVCVVTIIAVVGFEAVTSAIRGTEFLSFYVVVLLVILIFVAVGERITKIAISMKDGFFVEQSVQRDVQRFEEMGLALIAYRDGPSLSSLNALLSRLDEKGRDAWSKLIIIRLSLRATLRGLSKPYDPNLSESASLSGMLRLIKSKSVIGEEDFADLERIRIATYFAEWGAGDPPSSRDVEFVLSTAPRILRKLVQL